MRAFAIDPEAIDEERVLGCILAHDIVVAGDFGRVKLAKGHIVRVGDVPALAAYPNEIHLVKMAPDDVHEDEASQRLARAICGPGVTVRGTVESQTHLRAAHRGLVALDPAAIEAMNLLPDVSVFTVYDGQPVDVDRAVAATKVTPLAVPAAIVDRAEEIGRGHAPVLQVRPFLGRSVGVVLRDRVGERAREKFETAIYTKIGWFGSPVAGITYVPDDSGAIAEALTDYLARDVGLILAAGVNSTDPLDLTLQALDRIGAVTERRGVPAHPGSTCWLAYAGTVPIFGLAFCGMLSQTTVLDLLLPRFLSGMDVRAADIARFGHGGLLSKEMAFRFPRYGGGAVDQAGAG